MAAWGTRITVRSPMSLNRLLLVAAVTAATCSLLGACGDDGEESPEPTTRRDAGTIVKGPGFTVEMPANPKRETSTVKTPKGPVEITIYTVDRGDEAYAISVGKMPAGVEPDLDGAIDGAAANIHGTVAEREETEHQGLPARDARITDGDQNGTKFTTFLRVIGDDDRYYQLQYVTKGGDVRDPAAGYEPFLESLEID
jgi:hypothetical protein